MRGPLLIAFAFALAIGIFAVDTLTALDGAIAVMHIAVVLLVAPLGRRAVFAAGTATTGLTVVAFAIGHFEHPDEGSLSRVLVSLVAIAITTLLSLRDRSTRTTLSEQARILELSHDTVIIRDRNDTILYWNDGAEALYGWSRAEALGRSCQSLLMCDVADAAIHAKLEAEGQWSGEIIRRRRDGTRLMLASRWLLRRDPDGVPIGVIESSADLTEQMRSAADRRVSEQRYRAIFESAGFAVWEADWSATMRIASEGAPADLVGGEAFRSWLAERPDQVKAAIDAAVIGRANQAAADLFGAESRAALTGSNLCGRYRTEDMGTMAHILAALARGAGVAEAEMRLETLNGRLADVVLRVTFLPEGERWSNMLVTAFDVTERNEARARIEQTSAELAHAARVSMLGQLAASIVHEVNQPLTAIINYGKSGKRWLARPEPDFEELTACLDKVVANGTRAADVIGRVRGLARKEAPKTEALDLVDLVEDTIALVQREARAAAVVLQHRADAGVPAVQGDRVQVQQVLVNLVINGIQAMRERAGAGNGELIVQTGTQPDGMVRIAVIDQGTGFADGAEARIFEPFFTTKGEGMGIGLSICRSIIEGQGGRITAMNNAGAGATVAFTLPVAPIEDRVAMPGAIF